MLIVIRLTIVLAATWQSSHTHLLLNFLILFYSSISTLSLSLFFQQSHRPIFHQYKFTSGQLLVNKYKGQPPAPFEDDFATRLIVSH